jgi:hypothetical protein
MSGDNTTPAQIESSAGNGAESPTSTAQPAAAQPAAAQPAAAQPAAAQPAAAQPAAAQPAVAEQEYNLTLPEGVTTSPEAVSDFGKYAKENGISVENAQAILNYQGTKLAEQQQNYAKLLADNEAALKAHETLGNLNYDKTVAAVERVFRQFGGEELKKTLDSMGLVHDLGLNRFLVNIAEAISEDSIVKSSGSASLDLGNRTAKQNQELMYGKSFLEKLEQK